MNRERHRWNVQLQDHVGKVSTVEVANYWDPEFEGTSEAIGQAATIEAHMNSGKRLGFSATHVELVAE